MEKELKQLWNALKQWYGENEIPFTLHNDRIEYSDGSLSIIVKYLDKTYCLMSNIGETDDCTDPGVMAEMMHTQYMDYRLDKYTWGLYNEYAEAMDETGRDLEYISEKTGIDPFIIEDVMASCPNTAPKDLHEIAFVLGMKLTLVDSCPECGKLFKLKIFTNEKCSSREKYKKSQVAFIYDTKGGGRILWSWLKSKESV